MGVFKFFFYSWLGWSFYFDRALHLGFVGCCFFVVSMLVWYCLYHWVTFFFFAVALLISIILATIITTCDDHAIVMHGSFPKLIKAFRDRFSLLYGCVHLKLVLGHLMELVAFVVPLRRGTFVPLRDCFELSFVFVLYRFVVTLMSLFDACLIIISSLVGWIVWFRCLEVLLRYHTIIPSPLRVDLSYNYLYWSSLIDCFHPFWSSFAFYW